MHHPCPPAAGHGCFLGRTTHCVCHQLTSAGRRSLQRCSRVCSAPAPAPRCMHHQQVWLWPGVQNCCVRVGREAPVQYVVAVHEGSAAGASRALRRAQCCTRMQQTPAVSMVCSPAALLKGVQIAQTGGGRSLPVVQRAWHSVSGMPTGNMVSAILEAWLALLLAPPPLLLKVELASIIQRISTARGHENCFRSLLDSHQHVAPVRAAHLRLETASQITLYWSSEFCSFTWARLFRQKQNKLAVGICKNMVKPAPPRVALHADR